MNVSATVLFHLKLHPKHKRKNEWIWGIQKMFVNFVSLIFKDSGTDFDKVQNCNVDNSYSQKKQRLVRKSQRSQESRF